jgi:polyisoprenoid-binding protein YceI
MQASNWKSVAAAIAWILGIAVFLSATAATPRPQAAPATAQEVVPELDVAKSKVHFTLDSSLHMVHVTFALKSGVVHFDPENGKASGEIFVYARSGDSGNAARDERDAQRDSGDREISGRDISARPDRR